MSEKQLPRAYGHCTCSCHRVAGVMHMAACCSPSDEEREREWFERRVRLEDGLEIGVGGSIVYALPMTPTDNLEAGAGDLVERLKPSAMVDHVPGLAVSACRAAGDDALAERLNQWIVRNNALKYEAAAQLAAVTAENARLREGWQDIATAPKDEPIMLGKWVPEDGFWYWQASGQVTDRGLWIDFMDDDFAGTNFQAPTHWRAALSQEAPK